MATYLTMLAATEQAPARCARCGGITSAARRPGRVSDRARDSGFRPVREQSLAPARSTCCRLPWPGQVGAGGCHRCRGLLPDQVYWLWPWTWQSMPESKAQTKAGRPSPLQRPCPYYHASGDQIFDERASNPCHQRDRRVATSPGPASSGLLDVALQTPAAQAHHRLARETPLPLRLCLAVPYARLIVQDPGGQVRGIAGRRWHNQGGH